MRKRWFAYAVWLLLAACLYFFENNTGTRVILACALLFPLIPPLRGALFGADVPPEGKAPEPQTVRVFVCREADEPGDVRAYRPGDPIRRIHWKLSAKKDELLIRETAAETETVQAEQFGASSADELKNRSRKRLLRALICAFLLCAALLALIPEANHGAQALFNRLFAASESVNAYVYDRFPVPEEQPVFLAAVLLTAALLALVLTAFLLKRRAAALCLAAAFALLQAYFGLSFPAWINIPLYGCLALAALKRPLGRGPLIGFCAAALSVALLTALLCPGVDAATEAASEAVRDRLSRIAQQITGSVSEAPEGETETRHIHTRSLEAGDNEAATDGEFRLVTVEEEQISQPYWINYLKIALLLLLSAALVILPFAPFVLLNARKKKAQEIRKAFASENVNEAVCAIFRQVIAWLSETGFGADNRLYREWADTLLGGMPEGYAERFSRCAEDYEEAAYSSHALAEEKRRLAMDLLKETETALWKAAGRKQRLRLKYWMCLYE